MMINQVNYIKTDVDEALAKIREMSQKSKVFSGANPIQEKNDNFHTIMNTIEGGIETANTLNVQSDDIKNRFVSGDKSVSLSQVIVSSEKSKMAFEGLISVRNKLLEAYKEIMNMPV